MLGLLGDEWTLLVVQQALMGATRYAEFKARLPISNSVLTRRLQTLTTEGLLDRRAYQTNPPRSEYVVTARGRSLWPVLVSIWEWERHWVPDHAERLPGMRHTSLRRRLRSAASPAARAARPPARKTLSRSGVRVVRGRGPCRWPRPGGGRRPISATPPRACSRRR